MGAISLEHPAGGAQGVMELVSYDIRLLPLLRAALVRLAWLCAGAGGREEPLGALLTFRVLRGVPSFTTPNPGGHLACSMQNSDSK